jgi:streptogramin lyase
MNINGSRHPIWESIAILTLAASVSGCGGSTSATSVTLGGSISGLTSEGLTIKNGTEVLALHSGEPSFVFATTVSPGSTYTVQIASQPTSRDQVCTIASSTGTAGSSNIAGISVSCHATLWVTGTLAGSGAYGSQDGPGSTASFSPPSGVAVDGAGNVYVADTANQKIRRIDAGGVVTTFAGTGNVGSADGAGTTASFNMPWRVSAAADSTTYVTDTYNLRLRKISATGDVTTFSGSGSIGAANGAAASASFYYPFGLAVSSDDHVYVADNSNQLIRKLAPDGGAMTFAGSGSAGFVNGTGSAASFQSPYGIAVDALGFVYVADTLNHCIRKISPVGMVTTLAGIGTRGSVDGSPTVASFSDPQGVAVDANGNVYVADTGNNALRKISPSGVVTTIAGNPALSAGSADGVGAASRFYFPFDVAVDRSGVLYVADWGNSKIRRVSAQ